MSALECAQLAARIETAVGSAFAAESAADYHIPGKLSMSGVGGCIKACALAWSGEPVTDPPDGTQENRAANLGRWIHAGLLPRLADTFGHSIVEMPVVLDWNGVDMTGNADLVVIGEELLLDLKTINPYVIDTFDADQVDSVPLKHRLQVYGYAEGCRRAGIGIRFVGWIFLDRAFGGLRVVVEELTDVHTELLYDRYSDIDGWSRMPDEAPREGLAMEPWVCGECCFRQRCLGAGVQPEDIGTRRLEIFTKKEIADAAMCYRLASKAEKEAKLAKEASKKVLFGQAAGEYGESKITYSKAGVMKVAAVRNRV